MVLTTDSVPERERFSFWCDGLLQGVLGMAGEAIDATPQAFDARITVWSGGGLTRLRGTADAHLACRSPREIARRSGDAYWLHRDLARDTWFDVPGRGQFVIPRGELILSSTDHPHRTRPMNEGSRFDGDYWVLPRVLLEPHLPAFGGPPCVTLSPGGAGSGMLALLTSYLDSLGEQAAALSDTEARHAGDILCRLIAAACGTAPPEQKDALRAARLAQIKRHVDRHLTEMDLSPGKAAAALGISVRSLHLAFEPTGTSFAEHVTRRRLQECRAALERPAASPRAVTDVAFAWGFASLATFYRAFRREFGMAPGDLRRIGR
ncbi:helix-turn-helix domain-containing protein [Roseicella sp. DB1501]|uniref:helix-turn-helix domain-containing protein n=1 Tax=Roseicella sp. DB1501 TaxID=2730925 RepID=UPI0014920BCB|nr:helix-turn-helix domain-containing protein [Roseicella sp. DB1501]NOG70742.1 helix-turn-helix domain-containing protein [Roseicella sp. DB1501]